MYVAYGWPKLLSIDTSSPQPVVHLSVQGGWLLLVTATQVQVWSADQHTTKLGHYKRELQSRQGSNVYALWSEKDKTVAVLTCESYLHFYHIKVSEKQLRSSVHDNSEDEVNQAELHVL